MRSRAMRDVVIVGCDSYRLRMIFASSGVAFRFLNSSVVLHESKTLLRCREIARTTDSWLQSSFRTIEIKISVGRKQIIFWSYFERREITSIFFSIKKLERQYTQEIHCASISPVLLQEHNTRSWCGRRAASSTHTHNTFCLRGSPSQGPCVSCRTAAFRPVDRHLLGKGCLSRNISFFSQCESGGTL